MWHAGDPGFPPSPDPAWEAEREFQRRDEHDAAMGGDVNDQAERSCAPITENEHRVDLTPEFELHLYATDQERLIDRLRGHPHYFSEQSVKTILNAMNGGPLTMDTYLQLVVNAAIEKARVAVAVQEQYLSCNINPACTSPLGHDGECDTECPF